MKKGKIDKTQAKRKKNQESFDLVEIWWSMDPMVLTFFNQWRSLSKIYRW
jgi:hypothetical protein